MSDKKVFSVTNANDGEEIDSISVSSDIADKQTTDYICFCGNYCGGGLNKFGGKFYCEKCNHTYDLAGYKGRYNLICEHTLHGKSLWMCGHDKNDVYYIKQLEGEEVDQELLLGFTVTCVSMTIDYSVERQK